MPDAGLQVIVPVRPGEEQALRIVLNRLGTDIRGTRADPHQPRIDFLRSRSIHFARLTLLPAADLGPTRQRLLFATDFDGSMDKHLREIISLTQRPEEIWGRCEGYTDAASFPRFIQEHQVPPDAYYIAFRGHRLGRLKSAINRRVWFHGWLSAPGAERVFRPWRDLVDGVNLLRAVGGAVYRPLAILARAILATVDVAVMMFHHGFKPVLDAARGINASLDRVWWIRAVNGVVGVKSIKAPHRYTQASPWLEIEPTPPGYPPEDAILQNQLTLVTDVLPEHRERLRAVLALIDLYGRRLSSPGSLVGISTIHTVRWTIIDEGRRLLMVSNYDGTWENYIDEFAEMILSGLDALWISAPDFPVAGAQDLAALKQFLRLHQAPANVFYSAYPSASVLNLKDALEFARWYSWIAAALVGDREPGTNVPPVGG